MHCFKDKADRTWKIEIHVTAAKEVRAILGVNLYSLVDDGLEGLRKLLSDPIDLVDVIYVLCREEAEKRNVTDKDFGRALWGDAIDSATNAFLEELTDFFQDPRVRAGLAKVIEATRKMRDRLRENLILHLDQIDPNQEADKLIASFGNSPESSELTPDRLPSDS